ncbi:MAG: hypothetical protein HFG60_08555 [Lachnospiraceae bacterium]|nr:hypothetical protein [Lachnospiraceae bacterium]
MGTPHLPGNSGRHIWGHPTGTIVFDWKNRFGTPAGQKPAKEYHYKNVRTTEQWKGRGEERMLCRKENLQAKPPRPQRLRA